MTAMDITATGHDNWKLQIWTTY